MADTEKVPNSMLALSLMKSCSKTYDTSVDTVGVYLFKKKDVNRGETTEGYQ